MVVSTGTGSGKTESFLIPVLRDLVIEAEHGTLQPGVRALIIYPMNALANDQIERLREILADFPEITFGSYTGQTERERKRAMAQYAVLNEGAVPKPNELISREQMIETPPHILITNYAMLEYLMVRPKENVFFEGAFASHWKYVILDEAHIYRGSTGIEVSMLLRRLKASIPAERLQYMLTSATLGNDTQNAEVAAFAQKLCNAEFTSDDVIRAKRVKPKYDPLNTTRRDISGYSALAKCINAGDAEAITKAYAALTGNIPEEDLHSAIFDYVQKDQNYWDIRRILMERPETITRIAGSIGCTPHEIVDFVTVASYAVQDDAKLFDAKYHMFIRATDSAFITLAPSKRLFLTRRKKYDEENTEYTVFEMGVCKNCHSIYLLGRIDEDGYFTQTSMAEDPERNTILYPGEFLEEGDDDEDALIARQYKLCPHCGKIAIAGKETGMCKHSPDEYVSVYKVIGQDGTLKKCAACGYVNQMGVLRRFFTGQEAVTSVIGTSLFENMPSYREVKREIKIDTEDEFGFGTEEETITEKESLAKQFIAFSDNRQAAAFYAIYLERTYTSILYKRLIIETLKHSPAVQETGQFAAALQAMMEKYHVVGDSSKTPKKEAWKAILAEMVSAYSENALQNLGFYKFTVPENKVPSAKTIGLEREEVANIIDVCIQSMMLDAAIYYPVVMNSEEKEFFTFNGHEGNYTFSDNRKGAKAFLPAKAGAENKRLEYIEKIFKELGIKRGRDYCKKFLESIWNIMLKGKYLISESAGYYKVNANKIEIVSGAKYYQCPVCRKITPYNVRNVCPTYHCHGKLEKINISDKLRDNHYFRRYQDMDIRPLRVVEHTAQLSRERAYEYQNLFKQKKIDVLSCSTTFELGVDVGSLETVFMRNMPPSPANYAQRAGRAGRSRDSVAYALTFCNRSSHDFTYFNNPTEMIRGIIHPPVFNVSNDRIAIRHVFASALGFFWRGHIQYFSNTEKMLERDEATGISGVEELTSYLEACPEELKHYLASFLPADLAGLYGVESFAWTGRLLGNEGALIRAYNEYVYELGILKKAAEEAIREGKRVDYLNNRIKNYRSENILSFLSRKNVLPKYGFPVDTVEMSIYDPKSKNKINLDLQRDLSMAISEYAPGSQVIADGYKITSQYIRKIPNIGWKMFDYKICPECRALNIEPHVDAENEALLKECKVCRNSLEITDKETFIVPEFGFQAGRIEPAGLVKPNRTYHGDVSYVGYRDKVHLENISRHGFEYEIAFSQNDQMAVLNRSNFFVCPECGYTHLEKDNYKSVMVEKHNTANGFVCGHKYLRKNSLGYRFETDIVQVRFLNPAITGYDEALSILYGILRAACSVFDIEENEISGTIEYFYNKRNRIGSYSLIFYDRTPGGAGQVKRLNDPNAFEKVLRETQRLIGSCTCGGEKGDTSCYSCLRNYYNQRVHDRLQRRYVLDFLKMFDFLYERE